MRTVYKYSVPITDEDTRIAMPKNATIVHVGHQDIGIHRGMVVTFWAEVPDTDVEEETRVFRVHGTGHPMPVGSAYVGTDLASDYLVWHLFEVDR